MPTELTLQEIAEAQERCDKVRRSIAATGKMTVKNGARIALLLDGALATIDAREAELAWLRGLLLEVRTRVGMPANLLAEIDAALAQEVKG